MLLAAVMWLRGNSGSSTGVTGPPSMSWQEYWGCMVHILVLSCTASGGWLRHSQGRLECASVCGVLFVYSTEVVVDARVGVVARVDCMVPLF